MTPPDHIPPFPFGLNNNNNNDLKNSLDNPKYQASSSSSHSSCHHFYFNSTTVQTGHFHHHHTEYYMPQHQPEVDNDGGSYDLWKKNNVGSGLKLTLWKREDKLVSSKVKDSNQAKIKSTTNNACIKLKLGDQKQRPSSPIETEYSSNNIPTRVCADCNTTKTPLWRSGPKGPKTLCNACGIRQRKARRAMAAEAEAAANGKTDHQTARKIQLQHKQNITKVSASNHVTPFKKRCKFGPSSSSTNAPKKLGFEDFLINLSNKLALQQIFPQDEKEAAILLMALSSGLFHG